MILLRAKHFRGGRKGRMARLKSLLFLLVILVASSACSSTRISGEIYLADIDELPESGELTTKILIGLPISGEDDCVEKRQQYNSVFRKSTGFKGMSFERCYKDGSDNLAQYSLDVPIKIGDPETSQLRTSFDVVREDDTASGTRHLYLRSKPSALCNLDDLLSDEFYQSLDLSKTSPKILISNDLRETQTLILDHIFVNGQPVIVPTEFEMERRDDLHLQLSNVTAAWVFNQSCRISLRYARIASWVGN